MDKEELAKVLVELIKSDRGLQRVILEVVWAAEFSAYFTAVPEFTPIYHLKASDANRTTFRTEPYIAC